MRHLRWQVLIALLGMVLVGGLLAGQGQGGSPIVEIKEPAPGGRYIEALVGAPQRLNPLLDFANPVDRDIDRLVFAGLTRFDDSGLPAPGLATWSIAADQVTYTFILKPNLQWHDGQPLTTEDVAFTVSLLQDSNYPGPADVGRLWQSVRVEIISPQIVVFTLPEPFAPFLDYTAIGLLPQHLLGDVSAADLPEAGFNQNPVGSGPFKVERFTQTAGGANSLLLSAFPGYAGPQPNIAQVQFNFYPDAASALAAYQRGEVLGVSRLEKGQMAEALKLPELGLHTSLLPEYSLIFLNLRDETLPFFKDKKVRQALLLGMNRQAMVQSILDGQAVVANSPVLPGSWAYNESLPVATYDPETAAGLLESAGWVLPADAVQGTETYVRQKDGVPINFTLAVPNDPVHVAIAQATQVTWARLGVRTEIAPVEPDTLRADYLEPRAFQAILVDFSLAGTPDPDPYPLWHETQAESGQNYSGFSDRLTSELLEQARITTDITQRAQLYRSFQSRFADQAPALLLYYPVYNYGVDVNVNGVQIGPLTERSDRFNNFASWYIVTRRVIVENPSPEEQQSGPTPEATP
ncbi:MAG: peptide ABC transporter substrate-binding protein [Anaerolineales bacterium]